MKRLLFIVMVVMVACRKDRDTPIQLDPATEIFFISRPTPTSNWQLQLMQGDGSNGHVIPGIKPQLGALAVSHDGKKIAWTVYENGNNHLYVTDKTGGTPVLLASGAPYCDMPDWSPDDSKIIFMKGDNTERAIYVVDSDGKNEKRLTPGKWSAYPKWLPDGNTIVYGTTINNTPGIYTMKADGSDPKKISASIAVIGPLFVSPAGNKIAITVSGWEQPTRIFVITADGSNLKEVTAGLNHFAEDGVWGETHINPAWSPDGKKIAYVSSNGSRSEIYVMNSDGTGDKRLAYANKYNNSPSWSKDGKCIVFASGNDDGVTKDIYIMKANGRSQTALTKNAGYNEFPVFVTP